jgi:hypothetical protein
MCKDFAVCHKVQTGSETHLVFCVLDGGGSFTIGKEAQMDADHSPSCISEVLSAFSFVLAFSHCSSCAYRQLYLYLSVPFEVRLHCTGETGLRS